MQIRPTLRRGLMALAFAATAVPALAPTPAAAWWHHPWGWHHGWHRHWGPGPVVVAGRPFWVPGHWRAGYWVPGHWA